jgi:hypothetical protein
LYPPSPPFWIRLVYSADCWPCLSPPRPSTKITSTKIWSPIFIFPKLYENATRKCKGQVELWIFTRFFLQFSQKVCIVAIFATLLNFPRGFAKKSNFLQHLIIKNWSNLHETLYTVCMQDIVYANMQKAMFSSVLGIRDVYPGSEFFPLGSRVKNLIIVNPKNSF